MQFVVLLFSDLPDLLVGGFIIIWYIYQVIARIFRYIRTNLTGGGHRQFGSFVKDAVINNVNLWVFFIRYVSILLLACKWVHAQCNVREHR